MKDFPTKKSKSRIPSSRKRLRNKADTLLQARLKDIYIRCLLCGGGPVVGHHFINKANSLALRYDWNNLVPLCQRCHLLIHTQPAIPTAKIAQIKGAKWLAYLEKIKRVLIKDNLKFYENAIKKYENLGGLRENQRFYPR